jgi:hypothetical protein
MPKADDTQALDTNAIKEAGINYRPRTRNPQQQQGNTVAICVVFGMVIILLGLMTLAGWIVWLHH